MILVTWLQRLRAKRKTLKARHPIGFTLVEMLLVVAIIGTLVSLVMPKIQEVIEDAKIAKAIGDLRALSADLTGVDPLPNSLADIGRGGFLDPWGNPYQYYNVAANGVGGARKDKFLVPLNSDFDIYSMGPDSDSKPPLAAKASKDDIIRANDGGYVGKASTY